MIVNPHDRLTAADPASDYSHHPRDFDGIIERVLKQPRLRSNRVPAGYKVRWLSGVGISGALMTGLISLMTIAAPSMPLLSLSAIGARSQIAPSHSVLAVWAQYEFITTGDLRSPASQSSAYELSSPQDPRVEAQTVADAFGITAAPIDNATNANANTSTDSEASWIATDATGRSVTYNQSAANGGYWSFTSTAPASPPLIMPGEPTGAIAGIGNAVAPVAQPPATIGEPTANAQRVSPHVEDLVTSAATGIVRRLAMTVTLTQPEIGVMTMTDGSTPTVQYTGQFTLAVDGISTDQNLFLTVDANGSLLNASGPLLMTGSAVTYPLRSPADAITAMNVQEKSRFDTTKVMSPPRHQSSTITTSGGTVPVPSTSGGLVPPPPLAPSATGPPPVNIPDPSGSVGGSAPSAPALPPNSGPTSSVLPGPPIVSVTLTGVSIVLGTYQASSGIRWLIPVFRFTSDDGRAWNIEAISSSLIQISPSFCRGCG